MDKKIYYHYCSTDTFFLIMDTHTLRFGNPLYMNDSAEVVWLMKLLLDVIVNRGCYQETVKNWKIVERAIHDNLDILSNCIPY